MKKIRTIQTIENEKIIAIVRTSTAEEAEKVVEAAHKGGIRIIEVTLTIPGALAIISKLRKQYGSELMIGAGTVLDTTTARMAIEHKVDFVVSPHLDKDVVTMCHLYQIPIIPGAVDSHQVVEALKLDCGIIKLFPSQLFGPNAVRALKSPFPQAEFIPTGGVNVETLTDWLDAGALAVGVGGEMTREAVKTGDFDKVRDYAQQLVSRLQEYKLGRGYKTSLGI